MSTAGVVFGLVSACAPAPAPTDARSVDAAPSHAPLAEVAPVSPHVSLDALADAVRQRLAARGDPPCTWQHDRATARCPDGRRHDVPALWGIVQADPDPAARADALLAMIDAPPARDDFAAVSPFIHLRATDTPTGASLPLGTDDSGLRWQIELGLPGGLEPVDDATIAQWSIAQRPVDADAIRTAAAAHVDRIDPAPFWPLGPGLARARVGDGHDAARLLSSALADVGFDVQRAALVPDDTLVVADAGHEAELLILTARWRGPRPTLLRRDGPRAAWRRWTP